MGNINAFALIKLKFGKVSMIRLASSFNVVVEFGYRSMVFIGIDWRCCDWIIGLSFLEIDDGEVGCSSSLEDFIGGT